MTAILTEMRNAFHRDLIGTGTLTLNDRGIPSNADKSQKSSIIFASEELEEYAKYLYAYGMLTEYLNNPKPEYIEGILYNMKEANKIKDRKTHV